MKEYIEREMLIKVAESIRKNIDPNFPAEAVTVLANFLPAADAVEVIRCKDCAFSSEAIMDKEWLKSHSHRFCMTPSGIQNPINPDTDFCSRAKRKSGMTGELGELKDSL